MKTTVELPDELLRAVKIRSATEGRKLKDVMTDLIRYGLAHEARAAGAPRSEVGLPLVQCAHAARPEEEMTPDRVAEILLREEAGTARGPS